MTVLYENDKTVPLVFAEAILFRTFGPAIRFVSAFGQRTCGSRLRRSSANAETDELFGIRV
jgi:hypothetical protein